MALFSRPGVAFIVSLSVLLLAPSFGRTQAASQPGVDAPELAPLGSLSVGVRSITLIEPGVPDLIAHGQKSSSTPRQDRVLTVDVWYPAVPKAGAEAAVYTASIAGETPGAQTSFTTQGAATRDPPADRRDIYPLVVMSHGFGGAPATMSWLAENLASKGYVVAAPRHQDPPITDASGFAIPLLFRPLDIAFVAHALQAQAKEKNTFFSGLIDPTRVALAGYSMGGYGALTVAGAGLLPSSAARVPEGYLTAYASGGPRRDSLRIEGLKAVVAISPFGAKGPTPAWGSKGLLGLTAPALFIVGDQDHVVGFSPGVETIFNQAVNSRRTLVVFENAGHSIGMIGAPVEMRRTLWDLDWFEDPVWRKDRVIAVNLHMITAFLDLEVKGDQTRASFLKLISHSNDGAWPSAKGEAHAPYDRFSSGAGDITVWKGFQDTHYAGLEFRHAEPARSP